MIGGTNPGEGNVITNSGDNGVEIVRGAAVTTRRATSSCATSIFGNDSLAMDLGNGIADGITANDIDDADTAAQVANAGQNFPVLTSVASAGGNAVVTGTLTADTPSAGYRVELYENPACNPLVPNGEGETFRGAQTVTTNAAGDATFSIPVPAVAPGDVVTATATRSSLGHVGVLGLQDGDGGVPARRAARAARRPRRPRCPRRWSASRSTPR